MPDQPDFPPYAISIIVPCLNEEKVIEQTLARLLETPPDVEIVVVDGGSTDKTLRHLAHPRVRLLQTTRGRGISSISVPGPRGVRSCGFCTPIP